MSDGSLIFNAKGVQIGYIEDSRTFDLTGRERCNYARATGNLTDLNDHGTFVGLSWISDELFGKPSGEVHPDRARAKEHQRPRKDDMQPPEKSNVKELKEPLRTATVPQPENPVEHSSITNSGGDPETGANASEKVADEVPVSHREFPLALGTRLTPSSTQDELVGRAIDMIRSALENGSA